jgi:glutathione synthase/RimK-type ligase-like ATP-grasp enzyme
MQRIAIATSSEHPHGHEDDRSLFDALGPLGLHPQPVIWNDPAVAWERFDAVWVRTTWDYYLRYPEFLAWLQRLDAAGVVVCNRTAVLRWNADKRYLLELGNAGVSIVPSRLAPADELAASVRACPWPKVVVKPTVSAGAWHTVVADRDADGLDARLAGLPDNLEYLIQPCLDAVAADGEWSLLYFGGVLSHCVLKRTAPGDFRVQARHGGTAELAAPPAVALQAAEDLFTVLDRSGRRDLAVARVDGVVDDGRFLLMEVELIEPQLFLSLIPEAGLTAARQFRDWLRRQSGGGARVVI